ncbi:MAG: dicarboxylate/amino acid:cation symporter [Brevundimonas sp.]|uniref:dicarboxylate/amino acid:cation symporter n=1 Tax=Brevundimonas sp. TaxID=1871086 RepID=UPI002773D574|nr:dicarboxylate/amino acid:cation symporter [Brevundimonas sp.]MDP3400383.1 dicarboxylate/amino acid:cation symporter [Brevundimonas sp.]MDZ4113531.1 dicarboxylate/amino acid:cation symporter [Brevundimonas sp.]
MHRQPIWKHLYFQVLVAITVGGLIGHFFPETGESMKPLGDAFIKLVKMVIAPVIFLTIVIGIAGMRDIGRVGRVAAKAFGYFFVFSTLALIIGLTVANVVRPGDGLNIDPATLDSGAVAQYAQAAHESTIVGFLMSIIPDSLFGAFTSGNILQVLFVSILFGIALALIGDRGQPIIDFFETASLAVFKLVAIVMKAAPIGALGAFAFTIGAYGIASIANLAALIATFYITSLVFVVGVLGLVAWANGFSIFKLIRYLKEELLLVLGTSSSEAALPSLIAKMERAGAAKSVVGLVVPTGYSFNLDGTNIYMTLAALFIAQALNIELSIWQQLTLLLVAMLSSKGAAGITGAGFITLAATLMVVPDVPVAGMALILGIDRFMSECRALTNFIGNAVATVVVARWEKALDTDALALALNGKPQPLAAPPDPAAGPGDDLVLADD